MEKILITGFDMEYWHITNNLRHEKRVIEEDGNRKIETFLQQMWQSNKGKCEWRDVETVIKSTP